MGTKNAPYFSIIIPVYNGLSHELPICLDSIWNQPLDKELYEVICVDDCSTDHTREWLDKETEVHPNLKVIKNNINIRQGGGEKQRCQTGTRGIYPIHRSGRLLSSRRFSYDIRTSAQKRSGNSDRRLRLSIPGKRENPTATQFPL